MEGGGRGGEGSLVHQEDDTDEEHHSSEQEVGKGEVVRDSAQCLHRRVSIATVEENCVVENSLSQDKIKDVLIPGRDRVNTRWAQIIVIHTTPTMRGREGGGREGEGEDLLRQLRVQHTEYSPHLVTLHSATVTGSEGCSLWATRVPFSRSNSHKPTSNLPALPSPPPHTSLRPARAMSLGGAPSGHSRARE